MRKILLLSAVFLLLGCAGSKPQPQAKEGDAEKCAIMKEVQDLAKADGIDKEETLCEKLGDKCVCVETIICGGKPTCYAVDYND